MKRMIKMLAVSMIMTLTTSVVGITAYAGSWQKTNYGWWYQNDDGTFPTNQWFQDTNGKWYHFNSDGYMQYGWLNDNSRWYYLSEDGSMIKDTWKVIDNKSYYFGSDGAMYANATTPDGIKVGIDGTEIFDRSNDYQQYIGEYTDGHGNMSEAWWVSIDKIENGRIYGSIVCGGIAEGEFSTTLKNNRFTATVTWQSNMAYDNDDDIPAPVQENVSLRLSVYENSPSIIIYNGTESERTLYKVPIN